MVKSSFSPDIMKKLSSMVLFQLITALAFAQSPWVKEKGEGYAQLGYSGISNYTSIYSNSTSSLPLERVISDRTFQGYFEYGIHKRISIIATIPIKHVTSGELVNEQVSAITNSGKITSFGNVELGARYQFYNGPVVASAQLRLSAPTASYNSSTGLSTGLPAWGIEPLLSVGQGSKVIYGFLYGGAGFRTNNYSHYGRFGGEVGITFKQRIWFILFVDVVRSFRNGTVPERDGNIQTGLYLNDQEYIGFGPKLAIEIIKDKFGLNVTVGAGASANNVARQLSFSAGIYYKWKPKEKVVKNDSLN
ncbi:MAG: hypothetical protein ACI837_002662 [Crocinitomicaceae bacterium]|jgi:hypothetical protein